MPQENKPKEQQEPQRKKATPKAQQKRKTVLVACILSVPFLILMYLIYGGRQEQQADEGLNTALPAGKVEITESSKTRAIDRVEFGRKPQEQSGDTANAPIRLDGIADRKPNRRQASPQDNIKESRQAYEDMTRQMNSLYNEPRKDPRIEQLQRQIAELTEKLEQKEQAQKTDPMAMVERSYALASKYLNAPRQSGAASACGTTAEPTKNVTVRKIADNTVSALQQPMTDSEMIARFGEPRNFGFHTAVGSGEHDLRRNAIRACIAGDQTLAAGSRARIRLLETIQAAETIIPAGTELFGTAAIEGQRLRIVISSIETGGSIIPVELTAYDVDGQSGLYIPDSPERTAAKEAAANIGTGFGTSVSIARSAGQQVAMDVARGVITGGSQYLSGKLREVKVTVKSNYQILLIFKE